MIVQCVQKKDLKQLRLVSKEWSSLATVPLFDRVFVSARKKDLEVWKAITGHPIISKTVRTLVYDVTRFRQDLTSGSYYRRLHSQMHRLVRRISKSEEIVDSGDPEINRFIEDYVVPFKLPLEERQNGQIDAMLQVHQNAHRNDIFILEGYRMYMEEARSQFSECSSHYVSFMDSLHCGLLQLENLQSVVLSSRHWDQKSTMVPERIPSGMGMFETGSPLSRSWDMFHLLPNDPWDLDDFLSSAYDPRRAVFEDLQKVTWALAATPSCIKSITIETETDAGIPSFTLAGSNIPAFQFDLQVYRKVEVLHLMISTENRQEYDVVEALAALPRLLAELDNLRDLDLNFETYTGNRHAYHYEQVFPESCCWLNMQRLCVRGISVCAMDLITLVLQPRLAHLALDNIDLRAGTWEGVIVALHLRQFSSFELDGTLTHCQGKIFGGENTFGYLDEELGKEIEDYVLHGARHPCLGPDQGNEAACRWYHDLLPDKWKKNMKVTAHMLGHDLVIPFLNGLGR